MKQVEDTKKFKRTIKQLMKQLDKLNKEEDIEREEVVLVSTFLHKEKRIVVELFSTFSQGEVSCTIITYCEKELYENTNSGY